MFMLFSYLLYVQSKRFRAVPGSDVYVENEVAVLLPDKVNVLLLRFGLFKFSAEI